MRNKNLWLSLLFISVALSLGACSILPSNQNAINDNVKKTVAAQTTLEAAVRATIEAQARLATPTPSVTPPPSVTPTPLPPTTTPTSAPSPTPNTTATATRTVAPPTPTLAPSPATTPRRLPSSKVIKLDPRGAGAFSYIRVTNSTSLDAVVVVVDRKDKEYLTAAYIRAGSRFDIPNIWAGTYDLTYILGEDWDEQQVKFTRRVEYHGYTTPLTFNVDAAQAQPGYTSTRYTYWEVSLAAGTNDTLRPIIPAEKFPAFKPN